MCDVGEWMYLALHAHLKIIITAPQIEIAHDDHSYPGGEVLPGVAHTSVLRLVDSLKM